MPTKYSYPICLGIFPDANLETCCNVNCDDKLHHCCQTEYEHNEQVDLVLCKYYFNCCNAEIKEVLKSKKERSTNDENDDGRNNDDNSGTTINLLMDHTNINLMDATDIIEEFISLEPEILKHQGDKLVGGRTYQNPSFPQMKRE